MERLLRMGGGMQAFGQVSSIERPIRPKQSTQNNLILFLERASGRFTNG